MKHSQIVDKSCKDCILTIPAGFQRKPISPQSYPHYPINQAENCIYHLAAFPLVQCTDEGHLCWFRSVYNYYIYHWISGFIIIATATWTLSCWHLESDRNHVKSSILPFNKDCCCRIQNRMLSWLVSALSWEACPNSQGEDRDEWRGVENSNPGFLSNSEIKVHLEFKLATGAHWNFKLTISSWICWSCWKIGWHIDSNIDWGTREDAVFKGTGTWAALWLCTDP